MKGFAVEIPPNHKAGQKDHCKKDVSEQPVGVVEAVVDAVVTDRYERRYGAHCFIHEAVDQKADHTVGKSAVVEKVPLVPGFDVGQNDRCDKTGDQHEDNSQECSA